MHPIVTVKSWVHNVHVIHKDELEETATKLFYDTAFWTLVILITLFVAAFILALNTPTDLYLNDVPLYPFMN
jgi:cobalamin biosynthesis protein CobD/CbiB